ncbi:MAG: DUF4346 domain-containing protein [Prochlorotrichaceae cyanobacterium]|jgi:dihydropteroate synthase
MVPLASDLATIDRQLSKRFIHLDPAGYFIIFVDHEAGLIGVKHYTNDINEKGLAVDPETGKPFPVKGKIDRSHTQLFTGRTAKEVGIELTEKADPCPLSKLDHALYLGRELVRAEIALVEGVEYIQD